MGVLPGSLAYPLARLEPYGMWLVIGLLLIVPMVTYQLGNEAWTRSSAASPTSLGSAPDAFVPDEPRAPAIAALDGFEGQVDVLLALARQGAPGPASWPQRSPAPRRVRVACTGRAPAVLRGKNIDRSSS